MSKFDIQDIAPFSKLSDGLYLILLHVTNIPPHLGIIYNHKYYSLTVNGQDFTDEKALIKLVSKKRIKTLLFEIESPILSSDSIRSIFKEKVRVERNVTCLYPIRRLFSLEIDEAIKNANYVYEVLELLYSTEKVKSVQYLNMENELNNSSFSMERYSMNDILDRINTYKLEETC